MNKNMSIIDIGANVGDTLVGLIASNSKLNYYSIEAYEYFFKYLKRNKEKIKLNTQTKIKIIQELVGLNLITNELGYIDFINKLNEIGYRNWTALNNYATIICGDKSYVDILNLIKSEKKNNIILDIYCKYTK